MNVATPVKKSTGIKSEESTLALLMRLAFIAIFDLGSAWFVYTAYQLGHLQLVVVYGVVMLAMNAAFLLPKSYPYRWLVIGFSFMVMFVIYPIIFTVYVAFTNYGDGHLVTREQALAQIAEQVYLPKTGKSYKWTAYITPDGKYALWLLDDQGNGFLAKEGEAISAGQAGANGVGELDSKGFPKTLEGYKRLTAIQTATDQKVTQIKFGLPPNTIQIRSTSEAAELKPRFAYDAAKNTLTDQENGEIYYDVNGTYTSQTTGKEIIPGYRAEIGLKNFVNFLQSPALSGPLVQIMTWNFIFPLLSVLSTFSLGLAIALMFNDKDFPFKKLIRSLLLIPYTIPGLITIIIWRGMMNPDLGVINQTLKAWFGFSPPWFIEPIWAQAAILLVNLWLGYPYFMLITSGALQSISPDLYEAAIVDGATGWQAFRNITLPLLLVAVGPLLLASYIYNFNNFNLIYLFIAGGPPIPGASTKAGYTDILISYVYALAFDTGGRGVQYGLASAITIILFIIVGAITLVQFRFTNMWEEVSKNV